jgi:hypothetical protein
VLVAAELNENVRTCALMHGMHDAVFESTDALLALVVKQPLSLTARRQQRIAEQLREIAENAVNYS